MNKKGRATKRLSCSPSEAGVIQSELDTAMVEARKWLEKARFDKNGFRKIEARGFCEAEWNFIGIEDATEAKRAREYEYLREHKFAYEFQQDHLQTWSLIGDDLYLNGWTYHEDYGTSAPIQELAHPEIWKFYAKWGNPFGIDDAEPYSLWKFFPLPYVRLPDAVRERIKRGSLFFTAGSFKKLSETVVRLRGSDPVSQYLWEQFPLQARKVLQDPESSLSQCAQVLRDSLNKILKNGTCIYDNERFSGIALSEGTKILLSKMPTGEGLVRLNRLLIEDAYPGEIAGSERYATLPAIKEIDPEHFTNPAYYRPTTPEGSKDYHLRIDWNSASYGAIEKAMIKWLKKVRPENWKPKRGRADGKRDEDALAALSAWRARRAKLSWREYSDLAETSGVSRVYKSTSYVRIYSTKKKYEEAADAAERRIRRNSAA